MSFRIGIRTFCKVDRTNISEEDKKKYQDFFCEEYIDSNDLWTYEEFVDKITKSIKKKEHINIVVDDYIEIFYCSIPTMAIQGRYSKENYNKTIDNLKNNKIRFLGGNFYDR